LQKKQARKQIATASHALQQEELAMLHLLEQLPTAAR
jgi:hypothetical protein